MKPPFRILASSFDYRPRLGGVATCTYELCRALGSIPGIELRLIAPNCSEAASFDATSSIETRRVVLPANTTGAMLPLLFSTASEIIRWRPDCILDFLWMPSSLASYLLSPLRAILGCPYFTIAHGLEIAESDRTLWKRIRRKLSFLKISSLRGSARVLAVSDFTRQLLISSCGVPPERTLVISNGVDPSVYFPHPQASALASELGLIGKKIFLTVARVEDYKGMDRVIAALPRVVRKHPEVAYVISGEGRDLPRLRALASHYRVEKHVRFLGAVSGHRLPELYSLAHCFMLLTREDWYTPNFEGFGLVFLEAAACGIPSIGGRSGGIPSAVVNGETGWLVDPEDPQAIADAMLETLDHPEELQRRGKQAQNRATQELTWQVMAAKIFSEMRSHVRH